MSWAVLVSLNIVQVYNKDIMNYELLIPYGFILLFI